MVIAVKVTNILMMSIVMVADMMMTLPTSSHILSQVLGSHKNLHVKGDGSEGDLVIIIIIKMTILEIIVIIKIMVMVIILMNMTTMKMVIVGGEDILDQPGDEELGFTTI